MFCCCSNRYVHRNNYAQETRKASSVVLQCAVCILYLLARSRSVGISVSVTIMKPNNNNTNSTNSKMKTTHTHTHIYTDIQRAIASTKDTAMTCHYIYSATAHLYVISHFHLLFRTHLLLAFCLSHIFFECICSCVHCTIQHFHQHLILFPCSFVSRE